MQELQSLETPQLIDLLVKYTADYSKLMIEGTNEEEYAKCNLTIKALQAEIESRKKTASLFPDSGTDITNPPDFS